jgi:hypothetical protein
MTSMNDWYCRAHPILSKEQFYTDAEIHWFGPQGGLPNWADPKEKQFPCLIHAQWAFKVIKLKKLPIEDLHLAPCFLIYLKRHAVVTFVVCAGRMDCRLGRLEKN